MIAVLAEEHGADLVAVEVLGETVNRLPRIGALEFEELARHGVSQAGDASDTIAHLVNLGDLLGIHDGAQGVEPSRQDARDALRVDGLDMCGFTSMRCVSVCGVNGRERLVRGTELS